MKEFFENIKKSIYNPAYYQELRNKPFLFSFKYYLLFSLCLAIILTIPTSMKAIPKMKEGIKFASSTLVEKYPEELEIKIKDGKASTNVAEPYFVKTPKEISDSIEKEQKNSKFENLLVIDTKSGTDLNKFVEYKTILLLTDKNIVFYNDGKITAQPLDKMGEITINRTEINSFLKKINPFFNAFVSLFPALIFLALLVWLATFYVYLFFGGLLILIVAKIAKVDIGYWKSYQMGVHLMTLPILAITILNMIPKFQIPFLFTMLLVAGAFINLKPAKKDLNIIEPIKTDSQPKIV
jgi:hypothetical protein